MLTELNLIKRALFSLGRKVINDKDFVMGKYKFKPIPTDSENRHQGVLEYIVNDENLVMSTTEPNLVLSLLSLLLRTDAKLIQFDLYGAFIEPEAFLQRTLPTVLTREVKVVDDMTSYLTKTESTNEKVFDRFFRSCGLYQKGLRFIKDDPILSFFLFVSALETLANTVIEGNEGSEVKYKKFVYEYSSDELKKENGEEFEELLNQAYKIRSKFTHFGTNYESPIGVADLVYMQKGLRYFKDYSKKPPEKVPSVYWFEGVVHKVLMEFLQRQTENVKEKQDLAKYALKLGTVTTKAARAIETGERVTLDDIHPE